MSPCTIGVVPVIFAAAMMLVLLSSAETFSCSSGRFAVPSNSSVTLVNCAATMAFTATNASNVVFTLSNASVTLDFINVSNITVVWDNSPLTYQDGDVSSWAPSINASLIRCRDCTHVHITMKDITIAAPIATAAISIETSAALDRQRVSYVSVVLDQVSLSMLKYYLVRVPSSFSNLTVSVVDSNIHLGHALEDACSLINNDIAPAGSAVFAPNFTFQRSNLFSACYLKNITGSFVQGIVVLNFARPQAAFVSTVVSVVQFVTFVVEQSNIQFQYVPNVDPNVAHSVVWDVRHRSMMITIAGLQAYAANTWLTGNQIFRFVDSTIASSGKVYAVLVALEGLSMQLASDIAAAAGLAVQAADVSNTPLHLVIKNTSFRAHVEGTLMSTAVRSVSGLRLDGSFTMYNAYISITNSTFDLSIQGGNNESVAEIVTSTTMAFIDVNSANTSTFIFEDTVFRGALTYGTMTPLPGEGYKYVVVIMAGLVASSSLSSTYNGCIVSVKRTQWVGGGNFGPSTGAFAFFFVTLTGPVVAAANMTDCIISVVDSQVFSSGVTVTKSPTTAATSGFIMTFVVCTLNTDDVVGSFLASVRPQTATREIAFSNVSITALRGTLTTASPQLTALPAPSFHSAVVVGGAYYNCNITAVSIGSPNNGFPVSSVSTPLWAVIIGASANVSNATSITIINCNSSNGGPLAHFSAEVPGLLAVATQHMDRGSSVVVRDGLWVRDVIEGSLRYCIEVRPTVLLRVSASVTYVLERNQFLGAAFQKVFSNRSSWFFDPYDLRATTAARPISIGCNIIQESEIIAVNMGSAPRGLVRVRGLGEPLNSSYTCMEAPYTSTVGYTCSVSVGDRIREEWR
ncbi:membrane-associated protein, putative [Bodo saltans]|uniref:Membrane-associated protein, putative n=1 Tax=Bodo saltans TaxID=75058 RepID=A0A0S4JHA1_BODSA|nr:membrane-associated protein, putative [Bodo saltans]|eukprot:CUG89474.1 membrane-associated protein, putative [Bodo saltans]